MIQITKYCFLLDGKPTKIHAPVISAPRFWVQALDMVEASYWDSMEEIEGFVTAVEKLGHKTNGVKTLLVTRLTQALMLWYPTPSLKNGKCNHT